jgi:hypothetical protein
MLQLVGNMSNFKYSTVDCTIVQLLYIVSVIDETINSTSDLQRTATGVLATTRTQYEYNVLYSSSRITRVDELLLRYSAELEYSE